MILSKNGTGINGTGNNGANGKVGKSRHTVAKFFQAPNTNSPPETLTQNLTPHSKPRTPTSNPNIENVPLLLLCHLCHYYNLCHFYCAIFACASFIGANFYWTPLDLAGFENQKPR